MGSSAGISAVVAIQATMASVSHADQASSVRADNPFMNALPSFYDPRTAAGATAMNAEISRQAAMVAYVDVFRMMAILSVLVLPMLLLLKPARRARLDSAHAVAE